MDGLFEFDLDRDNLIHAARGHLTDVKWKTNN